MQIVSGDAQKAVVGTELANPLVVKVLDSAGAIVIGQVVNFRVVAGGGTVFAGANITNSAGLAQERWTLGTSTADSQRVEVRAVDNATGAALTFAVFKAVALAGSPASVVSVVGDQSAAVRTAVANSPAVRVRDTYGNPVPGIAVTFAVASGGGTVSESSRATNDSGVATLTSWILGPVAGTNTVTATVTGLPTVSFTATGTAGAPTTLAFVVQPSGVTGAFITPAVQVAVQDAFGNTVAAAMNDVTVSLAANPNGGQLLGRRTIAALHGIATFADLWVDQSGNGYTLAANAAGFSAASSNAFDVALISLAGLGAGYTHSCGVTSSGSTYCWGDNRNGMLGDGTTTDKSTPTLVAGGPSFAAVTPGGGHTCGLTVAGAAYCWGANLSGELGDGTTSTRLGPTPVADGISFVAVSAGYSHTCGLTAQGAAYCWGYNAFGQLGDGTNNDRSRPVPVAGALSFVALSAGAYHTCGVTAAGAAYCWGSNQYGEIGDGTSGTTADRWSPTLVSGGISFTDVSAGYSHTCGVTAAGAAYCWGYNGYGQLGDGDSIVVRLSPVPVAGGVNLVSVSAGAYHTCGVTAASAAYCWGSNGSGELGDGTMTNRLSPVLVVGGVAFTAVNSGGGSYHSCGITTGGVAYCWGPNQFGQIGDGTTMNRLSPVRVVGTGP